MPPLKRPYSSMDYYQRKKARDMFFKNRYSIRKICRLMSLTFYQVSSLIRNSTPPKEIKVKAIEMYVNGDKLTYIAAFLKISKSTVHNYIKIYRGIKEGVTITLPSAV